MSCGQAKYKVFERKWAYSTTYADIQESFNLPKSKSLVEASHRNA